VLTSASKPYEITYIDLSTASRKIAQARAKMRGLKGIEFITGSLLDAAQYGPFDYIDCCGVLHHLPEPQQGFDALAQALAPGGGIGLMVYAPYGRSGVYPLQQAFGALTAGLPPAQQLAKAQEIYAGLPDGHPFKRNPRLVDHEQSDAGFYDLLLHSQDRPYRIDELAECLEQAGLELAGVPERYLYDLTRFCAVPKGMDAVDAMALCEKLDGTLKTHVVYARAAGGSAPKAGGTDNAVPHLKGVSGMALAQQVAKAGAVRVTLNGEQRRVAVPKAAASVLAGVDGRRDIAALKAGCGLDAAAWSGCWPTASAALEDFGLLLYSRLLV